jgi:hypothetical protein
LKNLQNIKIIRIVIIIKNIKVVTNFKFEMLLQELLTAAEKVQIEQKKGLKFKLFSVLSNVNFATSLMSFGWLNNSFCSRLR